MCTGVFFLLLTWRHTLPNSPHLPPLHPGTDSLKMSRAPSHQCSRSLLRTVPHSSMYSPPQLQLSRHPFFPLFFSIARSSATNALCFMNLLCLFCLYPTGDVNFVRVGFFVEHIHKRTNKRTNKPPHPQVWILYLMLTK